MCSIVLGNVGEIKVVNKTTATGLFPSMCSTLLQLYVNNGFSKCNKNPNVADTMMVVISLNRIDVDFETCLQPFNIINVCVCVRVYFILMQLKQGYSRAHFTYLLQVERSIFILC